MHWFYNWFDGIKSDFILNFITENRYMYIVRGFGVTIKVSLLSVLIGILIGVFIALAALSKNKILKTVSRWYTDIIRGTPAVTQLLIVYFVIFGSSRLDKWIIASIAFGINSGAYVSEIIRAGIQSVDHGQVEAGRSLGLSGAQTMIKIVIPQAVKNIFPALVNEFIVLIKETAIVGFIGLEDLAKGGDFIRSRTYSAFMPLVGTALIYFLLIKVLTKVFTLLEKRLRKSEIR
ncbi:MAG: amino acid ABC transporter permease [Ruminococcaceae bacterium]|nr:amino acid ABC transporter permease [Oscillospiraceae bacterium]